MIQIFPIRWRIAQGFSKAKQPAARTFTGEMPKLFSVLFAFTFLIAAPAFSAEKPSPAQAAEYQSKLFKYLDVDGDGKLTRKEFVVVALYDVFVRQGLDKSGKLTKAKFIKTFQEKTDAETEWAMMDTDNDGVIEFKDVFKNKNAVAEMDAAFRKIDTQNRGYVTLAQLQAEDQ